MSLNRFLVGFLVLQVVVLGFILTRPHQTYTEPVSALQTFDHSQCQYPARTTNPPNGCDNSDPCDPANVKGGSGDCENDNEEHEPIIPLPTEMEGK